MQTDSRIGTVYVLVSDKIGEENINDLDDSMS